MSNKPIVKIKWNVKKYSINSMEGIKRGREEQRKYGTNRKQRVKLQINTNNINNNYSKYKWF